MLFCNLIRIASGMLRLIPLYFSSGSGENDNSHILDKYPAQELLNEIDGPEYISESKVESKRGFLR